MANKLYSFQKVGIEFGLKNNGRVILADQLGTGKSLQALCIAWVYSLEWPLLIICPEVLKISWKDELLKWFGSKLESCSISMVRKSIEEFKPGVSKVMILSYQQATKKFEQIEKMNFRVIIGDEAHYLKTQKDRSKRTEALIPLCKRPKESFC